MWLSSGREPTYSCFSGIVIKPVKQAKRQEQVYLQLVEFVEMCQFTGSKKSHRYSLRFLNVSVSVCFPIKSAD